MLTIQKCIDGGLTGWGSEVKVIKPNGKVTYEQAYSYEDTRDRHSLGHKLGKKTGKGR